MPKTKHIIPELSKANLDMKAGLGYLVIGAALLVVGLIVAGLSTYSVTRQVLQGSVIIDETTLEPNLSLAATSKDLPAGHELLLSISGNPSDTPLEAKITEPGGTMLALFNITGTPFTSAATTRISGDHTLEIKNVGSSSVIISGAMITSPVGQQDGGVNVPNDPSAQSFIAYGIGILVGIGLVIAGIVVLIIGAIKYARGRKAGQEPKSTPQ